MTAIDSAPRLLLVEHDGDMSRILHQALSEEGYQVITAPSLAEALVLIEAHVFDVILTDSFRTLPEPRLQAVLPLLKTAAPTPVVVMTAWVLTDEAVQQAGFAHLINKPFDLDEVMATLAACLNAPLTPEQEQQAATVSGYIAAMNQHDIEQVLSYCTEDMVYQPPAPMSHLPHIRLVRGKSDYRTYLQEAFHVLQGVEIHHYRVFPHPTGLAVRYSARWSASDGSCQQFTASLVFRFAGVLIRQYGVHAGDDILAERLAQRPATP